MDCFTVVIIHPQIHLHMRIIYKRFLLLCLVAGGVPAARAQLILNRQVNAVTGGGGSPGNYIFQYTIGEITVSSLLKDLCSLPRASINRKNFLLLRPALKCCSI